MTNERIQAVLRRVTTWPQALQEELAAVALELESEINGDEYEATQDELRGIDRGLTAARGGRFARDADVKAVLRKHRPA